MEKIIEIILASLIGAIITYIITNGKKILKKIYRKINNIKIVLEQKNSDIPTLNLYKSSNISIEKWYKKFNRGGKIVIKSDRIKIIKKTMDNEKAIEYALDKELEKHNQIIASIKRVFDDKKFIKTINDFSIFLQGIIDYYFRSNAVVEMKH